MRIVRVEFQHFQVMLPRRRRIAQRLRTKVGQRQIHPHFDGIGGEQLFQFIRRVGREAGRLQGQRKIIARIRASGRIASASS